MSSLLQWQNLTTDGREPSYNPYVYGGAVIDHDPYRTAPPSFPTTTTTSPDIHATPSTAYSDTPLTLYKMSPETEANDWDVAVAESDDEDAVVRSTHWAPNWTAEGKENARPALFPAGMMTSMSDADPRISPPDTAARHFALKLNQDIRTAALFPSTTAVQVVLEHSTTATSPRRAAQHSAAAAQPSADVIATQHQQQLPAPPAPPQPPLARRPSLHLVPPAQPIDPFARPSAGATQPAPVVARVTYTPLGFLPALRRSQNLDRHTEPTVSPKDLVLPNAKFEFGFDPDAMVAQLLSPFLTDDAEEASPGATNASHVTAWPPMPSAGIKRSRTEDEESVVKVEDHDDADPSEDEDDDGEYREKRSVSRRQQPPTKRARVHQSASPAPQLSTSPVITPPRRTMNKPRHRNLQPHLVRNNPCKHGCDLLFSTPYEARRHIEDTHGREEAQTILSLSGSHAVYPKDYRFLIEIALHASDRWDAKTKAAAVAAQRDENRPVSAELVGALVEFARWWSKRYECPGCGLSFSRLDSKKRHFEKGCAANRN